MPRDPFELLDRDRLHTLADPEKADMHAVRAVTEGRATPDQQKRAMVYVIRRLCSADDPSFVPSSDSGTAFNEGRRFVGIALRTIAALPSELLSRDEAKGTPQRRQTRKKGTS